MTVQLWRTWRTATQLDLDTLRALVRPTAARHAISPICRGLIDRSPQVRIRSARSPTRRRVSGVTITGHSQPEEHPSAYGLRHRYGLMGIKNGVNLKLLSLCMGHARTQMTEHYIMEAGLTEQVQQAALQAVSGLRPRHA